MLWFLYGFLAVGAISFLALRNNKKPTQPTSNCAPVTDDVPCDISNTSTDVNPMSGLPMIDGSNIDTSGNSYGFTKD